MAGEIHAPSISIERNGNINVTIWQTLDQLHQDFTLEEKPSP